MSANPSVAPVEKPPGVISRILLEDRARKVLISIVVISVVLLLAIIVVSIIISYLRQEVSTATLSFDVGASSLWNGAVTNVCDPYNVQKGHYRLNFYSGPSVFVHTITIYDDQKVQLANIVVPQDIASSNLNYSFILQKAGTYSIRNSSNGEFIGEFTFSYPAPCPVM